VSSKILVSIRVAATPARAFEAFTSEIGEWWRPKSLFRFTRKSPTVMSFERGLGGRLIETSSDGGVFEVGRITVWEPGTRLAFTWRQQSFSADQITEVEVRFEGILYETRVTVEHRGWDSVPAEHVARHGFPDAIFLQRHGEWWQTLLESYRTRLG
jgi:uncharacterized protein YndB with AHSA1/START domain